MSSNSKPEKFVVRIASKTKNGIVFKKDQQSFRKKLIRKKEHFFMSPPNSFNIFGDDYSLSEIEVMFESYTKSKFNQLVSPHSTILTSLLIEFLFLDFKFSKTCNSSLT